ncbi:exosortase A [Massilia sp. Mn16-1_5]|uniref:exosortase A n=1 Tax=Massilia sp. Mn16-1_5 TaxID=2079199 RepID=UPI00109E47B7|nr:exosortase A [Massilia sp. Mn16-1_5]THC41672.1 exosortase A [Massilia sp. Mn16-1_5]
MLMNEQPALLGAGPQGLSVPRIAVIVGAFVALLLLYWGTAASMVSVWNSSETFAHGYAILPISLWLIWRRREVFSRIPAAPWWPALGLLALCGAGWLLARAGEVQVVMQYAFVAMFPALALALLGRQLAGALAFPLLFLLFAVPFGEVFVQPLINFTADFTVALVRATGIPVLRNGTMFELPTGNWSVVEACSGVRYLISSITLGCLYAYLSYRSLKRRVLFIGLSIIVPIIANGLRAYMIVMIGHTSDMALATGVDHLIYGWLFFGLVMFIMFWIGSYWREDEAVPAPAASAAAARSAAALPVRPLTGVAIAAVLVCALWPALGAVSDKAAHNPAPVQLTGARLATPASGPAAWNPEFMTPDASLAGKYMAAGAPVHLNVLYYRNQGPDKRLISSVNRVDNRKADFRQIGSTLRQEDVQGQPLAVRETRVKGPDGTNYLVWHWTWVDGAFTANDYVGKLRQARAKLMMHGDDGAAVLVATPIGEQPENARVVLRSFLAANLAPLQASLEAARGR